MILGISPHWVPRIATWKAFCPTPRKGVNVLLYGPPGTGKTEFARALAAALKRDLYEVPNVDKEGEAISGRKRFATYAFSQSILSHRPGQMLLFDEVEDVFGGGGGLEELFGLRFGSGPDSLRKSWVNETLETNPVPTIWACNSIRAMDRAYLRRFDLIVEMKAPGREVRRRMLARYFRKGQLSTACAERIADIEALPPAQIARAAKVLRALKCPDVEQRDQEVLRMLESSLRAMGMKCGFRHAVLPSHYDPAFINTTADLDSLAKGLARRGFGAPVSVWPARNRQDRVRPSPRPRTGSPGTGETRLGPHEHVRG
jgi:transitional endoplasmic reticulum ATPase